MIQFGARDLAIDLGTANTLIYEKGRGIILNEPSIVALRTDTKNRTPVAFGEEAKSMLGRTPPNVEVIRPVRTGVIADFETASRMLDHFMSRVLKSNWSFVKPRVIVGVPSGITEVERRAIRDAAEGKAREVRLIDEAMAAAIGSGLPVCEATASLIVDIGGGTTDIAVISLKDIVRSISVRQGGDAIDESIINHLRRSRHLLIGEATAELIKKTIGAAHQDYDFQEMEVSGRSLTTGSPARIVVTGREIREAVSEVLSGIVGAVHHVLENTPPELAGDILTSGITLAGGGSLIKGLSKGLEERLGVAVRLAENPTASVVSGAGLVLEYGEKYKGVWL